MLWFQIYNSYYSCHISTSVIIQQHTDSPACHLQIQQMLDALQLSQYKEAFEREQVDGEVLLELDDEMLQHELGVNFKIHRLRLMKIISGSNSAENLVS